MYLPQNTCLHAWTRTYLSRAEHNGAFANKLLREAALYEIGSAQYAKCLRLSKLYRDESISYIQRVLAMQHAIVCSEGGYTPLNMSSAAIEAAYRAWQSSQRMAA